MTIQGSVPFNSFKEQLKIMKDLEKEFGKKVRIFIENNLIIYRYDYIEPEY